MALSVVLVAPNRVESFEPNRVKPIEYSTDLGGGGYQEVRAAPHLAPAIALAAVVLAAMVAVSIQTQNNSTHIDFAH